MNHDQKKALLERLVLDLRRVDDQLDILAKLLNHSPEAPLIDAISRICDGYICAAGMLVGDQSDWLSWHIYENDYGRKGLEAGPGDQLKPIRTIDDLLSLIEIEAAP